MKNSLGPGIRACIFGHAQPLCVGRRFRIVNGNKLQLKTPGIFSHHHHRILSFSSYSTIMSFANARGHVCGGRVGDGDALEIQLSIFNVNSLSLNRLSLYSGNPIGPKHRNVLTCIDGLADSSGERRI